MKADIYKCPCGYGWDKSKVVRHHFCPNCGRAVAELEPCTDAISRRAVLNQTYLWSKDEFLRVTNPFEYLRKRINSLPPVTPQYTEAEIQKMQELEQAEIQKAYELGKADAEKVGRWIEHFDESGKWYECDQCHTDWGCPVNYCPNCGSKM